MRALYLSLVLLGLVLLTATPALATNGDNLIAIGPIARSMGGVGVAAPQDAISAVFANPAAMCFGPYCPSGEFNFSGSAFMPHVDAKISFPASGLTIEADSEEKVYPIPALGVSVPITNLPPFWRFGLSAYGVTGLGVDYKGTDIDQPGFYDFGAMGSFPLVSGEFTELSIMKFAPAIAFQPREDLSLGLALHVDYGSLDLRDGSSTGFGFGVQVGAIYKPTETISLGLNYVSPQNIAHDNVADFDGDGRSDTLDLESPQHIDFGIAYTPLFADLLIEADVKWINWSDADGYDDFDWNDQWVFAIGAQYRPAALPKLALRAGYNYGENPVEEHDNFNGMPLTEVQGKSLPTYYYETFRIIGFPAIVEHHITLGVGYDFTPNFSMHLGYIHGFEKTISQTGTDITGQPVELESTLSEDSLDFGLTWRF